MSGVESGVSIYENTGSLPSTYAAYEQLSDFKQMDYLSNYMIN